MRDAGRPSGSTNSGHTAATSVSGASGVRLQAIDQRAHRVGSHFHVRAKGKKSRSAFGRAGGDVHRSRRTQMVRQTEHVDGGKIGIELGAFVAAAAIDYQDFQTLAIARSLQRSDGAAHSGRLIESHQDGRDARALWLFFDARGLLGRLDTLAGGVDLGIRGT